MKEEKEEMDVEFNAECTSGCAGCSGCHEEDEEYDPTITLVDEDGKESKFEILDVIALDNEKQYLVVAEITEEEDKEPEAVILEIKEEDGEEVYDTVTDEAIAQQVFDKYIAQFEDEEEEETTEEE